uniref:Zeaxanthin epoxidase 3 n=1 Tax=Glycine max TaxID=3847 RepID=G0Z351_SOYBN|nr:zeaxanthin epoxidase 3 [Glycine max]
MASTLSCNSFNHSMAVFSKSHFSILMYKELSLDISPCVSYGSRTTKQRKTLMQIKATVAEEPPGVWKTVVVSENGGGGDGAPQKKKKLKVLVAGGGIGGLVFALAAKRKGFEVGQYRGPIQIQSNASADLEAIDLEVAEEVMRAGCITDDRINGLVDGISGSWYIKFDTFTPAAERGLPVTRVISRMTLQDILARAVGEDAIMNDSNVVDFVDHGGKVTVELENVQKYDGDLLVGADGIWSKVRKKLFGQIEATYSGYTCYTGIADFVPADIESVGYQVFLGHKQYFVSSDVGAGKMQWYGFHQEPAGGADIPNGKKERFLKIFEGWCDNRQFFDETYMTGRQHLHGERAVSPCLVILSMPCSQIWANEDAWLLRPNKVVQDSYQLALELDNAWQRSIKSGSPIDIDSSLKSYERERRLRVAIVHGMARMAAMMASTYKAYLGVGLGPLEFLTKFWIPHPGRVGGRFFTDKMIPLMLNWILGGVTAVDITYLVSYELYSNPISVYLEKIFFMHRIIGKVWGFLVRILKDTWFECFFKPMLVSCDWSILAKQLLCTHKRPSVIFN